MGNGIKLLLMIFVGFLCIMVGARGQLGSLLGAMLTPQYMQQGAVQNPGLSLGLSYTKGPVEQGVGFPNG